MIGQKESHELWLTAKEASVLLTALELFRAAFAFDQEAFALIVRNQPEIDWRTRLFEMTKWNYPAIVVILIQKGYNHYLREIDPKDRTLQNPALAINTEQELYVGYREDTANFYTLELTLGATNH